MHALDGLVIVRMPKDCIPKKLLYGRITSGLPKRGNHNTYLNSVKSILRDCGITSATLENIASKREPWRATYRQGIRKAEEDRIERLIEKRQRRKARAGLAHLPV